MNSRYIFGSFAATLTIALAACSGGGGGGGGGGGTPPPPPVVTFSHTFPAGDAVAQKGTAWDIVGVTTTLTGQFGSALGQRYDTLRVDVTFAQDISNALPAPGQSLALGTPAGATQLAAQVLIDSDGNASTGVNGTCGGPSNLLPFEYVSEGDTRLTDGNYSIDGPGGGPIYSGPPNPPDEAVTTVSGHVLSQTFFLPAVGVVGGNNPPHVGLAVAAFNGIDLGHTDCVPPGTQEIYTDLPNVH